MLRTLDNEVLEIGTRIKVLRLERGMQQTELADKLEISQTNMSNIERGRTGVTIQNLLKMRKILGCTMNDFFVGLECSSGDKNSLDLTDVVQILKLLKNSEIKGL